MAHWSKRNIIMATCFIAVLNFGTSLKICIAGGQVHGARSAGMGTAFVAVADDPSAIAINPAGLTRCKGTQIYSGVTAVRPSTTYKNPAGADEETENLTYFPPHLYLSSQLGTGDWTLGLGLYSLFGVGGLEWPDDGLTRFISTESTIATFNANPTVAWQVNPQLSLAAGAAYMYSRHFSKARFNQSMLGAHDGEVETEADGGGFGVNLGLLYQPVDRLSIGLSYRSPIEVDHDGEIKFTGLAPILQPLTGGSRFKTDVSTTLDFPEIYSFGLAWRRNDQWVVALDVEWVGWSRFKRTDLDLEDEIPVAGITDQSQLRNWKDVWLIKIGAEYQLKRNLALRCGYAYIDTPVPKETLGPANPDAEQHMLSIGLGYRRDRLVIDVFYTVGYYEDRTVNNSILSGRYENMTHYAGLSIGYRFSAFERP